MLKSLTYTPYSPAALTVPMAKIAWQKPDGRCALLPDSLTPLSSPEPKTFIPYGATRLRITELPQTE